MQRLESLTPEQDARLDFYYEKWLRIGLDTAPIDEAAAREAIVETYKCGGLEKPKEIIFVGSPIAAITSYKLKEPGADAYGQHDAAWLGFYDFFGRECGLKEEVAELSGLMMLAEAAGWCYLWENRAVVCAKPDTLHTDKHGNLHMETSHAIGFPDGTRWHYWHGVAVPDWVIEAPERITIPLIEAEKNQEARRVLIERFGHTRYIEESGAKLLYEDKCGKLYQKDIPGYEPLLMVRVVNSTPEADGTRHVFYLRVDPRCRPMLGEGKFGGPQALTARNAVASTIGKRGEEYAPEIET